MSRGIAKGEGGERSAQRYENPSENGTLRAWRLLSFVPRSSPPFFYSCRRLPSFFHDQLEECESVVSSNTTRPFTSTFAPYSRAYAKDEIPESLLNLFFYSARNCARSSLDALFCSRTLAIIVESDKLLRLKKKIPLFFENDELPWEWWVFRRIIKIEYIYFPAISVLGNWKSSTLILILCIVSFLIEVSSVDRNSDKNEFAAFLSRDFQSQKALWEKRNIFHRAKKKKYPGISNFIFL